MAKTIEVDLDHVPAWRKRYREAVEIADAATPVQAFRNVIRQSIMRELGRHQLFDAELESAVKQVCYRASDLLFLLQERKGALSKHSEELRRED